MKTLDFTKKPAEKPVKVPKLVRDLIPLYHERDGCHSVTRAMGDHEYAARLEMKLEEELKEFFETPTDEEYADVLEVLRALAIYKGLKPAPDTPAQAAKREQLGGFEKRLLLTEFAWRK